jgi:polyhydroxyalkanoate synthesis regulator protein
MRKEIYMSQIIKVKKYSNRKLYLVKEHRYVTVMELYALLQLPNVVLKVTEYDSGKDITASALLSIQFHADLAALGDKLT